MAFYFIRLHLGYNLGCVDGERATPDSIPNSEVKSLSGDGTARATVWESSSMQPFILIGHPLAQLVEHLPFKQVVPRSSRGRVTIKTLKFHIFVCRRPYRLVGLGHRPFTAATGVQIPLGMPFFFSSL